MTRTLIIAICLAAIPAVTDFLVDYSFKAQHPDQNIGYSQTDRDGMTELVEREALRNREQSKRHRILSGSDEQAVLRYLWGDGN